MDFINKYKLGLEWDDYNQSKLFIVDKKAKIKSPLKIVTVPTSLPRAHHLETLHQAAGLPPIEHIPARQSSEATFFGVSCMKQLENESGKSNRWKQHWTNTTLNMSR